ncbi:MAG: FecR domain-containing protein [Tannerella sp.]|jgi:ferric-dicitrate binding protein FerR (iron transport regulator)|nr:FecR domain-containing protein [Tannerella sp.]
MKDLDEKYRRDELSPEELKALREAVRAMPDEEVGQRMYERWTEGEEPDVSRVEAARMESVRRRIDRRLGFTRPARTFFAGAGRIAAAAVILLLAFGMIYFYRENRQRESEDVVVATGRGEQAHVTLPDGTQVTLNAESTLRYMPRRHNESVRQVCLEGEAFFRVSSEGKRAFRIEAVNLYVTVSGTAFNLLARREGRTAELMLEEGRVRFASVRTGREVVLEPGQKAILDHANGEITVLTETDIRQAPAWKRGELVFRNTPLAHVLQALEDNYGISIEVDCGPCLTDSFTGTFRRSDLNETLHILEKTCHLRATLHDGEIRLTRE